MVNNMDKKKTFLAIGLFFGGLGILATPICLIVEMFILKDFIKTEILITNLILAFLIILFIITLVVAAKDRINK